MIGAAADALLVVQGLQVNAGSRRLLGPLGGLDRCAKRLGLGRSIERRPIVSDRRRLHLQHGQCGT